MVFEVGQLTNIFGPNGGQIDYSEYRQKGYSLNAFNKKGSPAKARLPIPGDRL